MSRPRFLCEADAYPLLEQAGLHPPRHGRTDGILPFAPGEAVVLKGLGDEVWHKSELGCVRFRAFDAASASTEMNAMRTGVEAAGHRWLGGLVCERITGHRHEALPTEAFVSLVRGAAGWTVLCGFGGLSAEALAELAPPLLWPQAVTSPRQASADFQAHLLGRLWLGRLRGSTPLTTPERLDEFFQRLWTLTALASNESLVLLELNPVVLDQSGEPRPLDAVGRRGEPAAPRLVPPAGFLQALRAPRRIAIAGVSAQPGGIGRTILENLRRYPLPAGDLVLIKPGQETMLGLPCRPDVSALTAAPVDFLILAVPAPIAVEMTLQLIAQGGGATVVALVSGGIGDGADSGGQLARKLEGALRAARVAGAWTPALLGPNFLGHWVPPAHLDTSFIPIAKIPVPDPAGGDLTLVSQSGAFLLSRRSRQPGLRFGMALALGNQLDISVADALAALAADDTGGPVAAYVEGFGPGQLETAAAAIARLRARGRRVVIHRAGRTVAGQAAAASHTGAMAGDLALERALLGRAGALFTHDIADFDAALAWLGAHPNLQVGPVAMLTNAGFESVNGGDLLGPDLPAAVLPDADTAELAAVLVRHGLAGLVAPHLPLDLTPMADEAAFLSTADVILKHSAVLIVGLVPFTSRLRTDARGAENLAVEMAALAHRHAKPIAVVVDAGDDYATFRAAFARAGLPVFARMENALRGLRAVG
jgi:acyl-CoA synthetase (NDP forming)